MSFLKGEVMPDVSKIVEPEGDLLAGPAWGDRTPFPSMLIGNPEPMREDELWRCARCGSSLRTNEEIKRGKRCRKCGSRLVITGQPTWWETVKLFFRTGTIFLLEPAEDEDGEE